MENICVRKKKHNESVENEERNADRDHQKLTSAVKENNLELVRGLVEQRDVEVDITDKDGNTLLMVAAEKGNLKIVEFLAGDHIDVNVSNDHGHTALMLAAGGGHVDVVHYLIESGADLTTTDERGLNVLLKAASKGQLEVVEHLTQCGMDVNARDNNGCTAIMLAVRGGNIDTVRHLVNGNASLDIVDGNGATALMWAAGGGYTDVIRYFSGNIENINATDGNGGTALMWGAERGHVEVVRLLTECGADLNITSNENHTALMKATMNNHAEVVQFLVKSGVDVNITDDFGRTALLMAAEKGSIEIVQCIFENCGTDVNAIDKKRETALMKAAGNNRIDVVRYLADHEADVSATNDGGFTALILSAKWGHLELVRCLAEQPGSDVNVCNNNGSTALMKAAVHGRMEVVRRSGVYIDNKASISSGRYGGLIHPSEITIASLYQDENFGGDYRAKWLDADAVVKLYIPEASQSVFKDELCFWQKLRHPNVIKIYGACYAGPGLKFFVCEYASQGSLLDFWGKALLRSDTITPNACDQKANVISTKWKYLHESALGLAYLHERDVVHGNLRCSNILIGSDGLAKLSNFRLSNSIPIVGPMRWQPPEVVKGELPTIASDVYSFGMCILEAATMEEPWYGEDENCVRGFKTSWDPKESKNTSQFEPQCPPGEVHDLVWRMCCQNPNDRPSLLSIVYELERLSMKESTSSSESDYKCENTLSFEGYAIEKLNDVWSRVTTCMENCENELHQRIFEELNKVHRKLEKSTSPTLLTKFHALLTEFYQAVKMPPQQARLLQLSSTRATTTSVYALHWRIDSLLKTLEGSLDTLDKSQQEWNRQHNDQLKFFVSGVSDTNALLQDLKSMEERSAFLRGLEVEIRNSQSKYTSDQIEKMRKTQEEIASTSKDIPLAYLTSEWFIPWYELIIDEWSNLGTGGFGSVCRGKWLDSDVVVKQILLSGGEKWSPDYSCSSLSLSLSSSNTQISDARRAELLVIFRREVDIWFGLSHPHIIRLFGACHVGRPFFVCEYATNGIITEYLQKHPDQLWRVLHETALGVQYLHARGIIHGDLKGNNIVVGSDKKAKVTDFGLSSIAMSDDDKVQISTAVQWVAPECFPDTDANAHEQAKTRPTLASDIFSLGMCIVEALRVVENVVDKRTGTYWPWRNLDNVTVKHHAKKGTLPSKPANCTEEQWNLVERMCVLEPQKRIKISTVVDELAIFANIKDIHVGSIDSSSTKLVDVESVPEIIIAAQNFLARLQDNSEWKSVIDLYISLWDRFEVLHKQIPGNPNTACKTKLCSLVADAEMATKKLQELRLSLLNLTETTMRYYALHRRLDKFCDAYGESSDRSMMVETVSSILHDTQTQLD